MNGMMNSCKFHLARDDMTPWKMTKHLNETPFGAIQYRCPLDAVASMPMV